MNSDSFNQNFELLGEKTNFFKGKNNSQNAENHILESENKFPPFKENQRVNLIEGLASIDKLKEDLLKVKKTGDPIGLHPGWDNLYPHYRVEIGETCVITGYPGSGKSEFMDSLSVNLAVKHNFKFLYYTPETKPLHYHPRRIIQKFMNKPFVADIHKDKTRFRLSNEEIEKGFEFYKKHYAVLHTHKKINIEYLMEKAKLLKDEKDFNALVIDPWNKLESSRPKGMTETDYIADTLDKISSFGDEFKISIWIVAHPAKPRTNHQGQFELSKTLYAINGSAHWFNKIDNGMWVSREKGTGKVKIDVLKIKKIDNGSLGSVEMNFDRDTGVYTESYEF